MAYNIPDVDIARDRREASQFWHELFLLLGVLAAVVALSAVVIVGGLVYGIKFGII